jgi:hypothetical protein
VIAGDERHELDLLRRQPAQVAVADDVVRVLGVRVVADHGADVVQERRVVQERAHRRREVVVALQAVVERESEVGDVARVRLVAAELREHLEHAP